MWLWIFLGVLAILLLLPRPYRGAESRGGGSALEGCCRKGYGFTRNRPL